MCVILLTGTELRVIRAPVSRPAGEATNQRPAEPRPRPPAEQHNYTRSPEEPYLEPRVAAQLPEARQGNGTAAGTAEEPIRVVYQETEAVANTAEPVHAADDEEYQELDAPASDSLA